MKKNDQWCGQAHLHDGMLRVFCAVLRRMAVRNMNSGLALSAQSRRFGVLRVLCAMLRELRSRSPQFSALYALL